MEAATALLLLLSTATPTVEAQPTGVHILGAEVLASTPSSPDLAAGMKVVYRMQTGSASTISLSLLGTSSNRIEDFRAELDKTCQSDSTVDATELLHVTRATGSGPLQRVTVTLPQIPEPDRTVCLDLYYSVTGWSPRPPQARLPLPIIEGGQVADSSELFRAEVVTSPGTTLTDSFPSDFDEEPTSAKVTYRTRLPAVPAFLQFDLHQGSGPLLTPSRLADAITVGALVLVLALAWYRFRELEQ